ncbi:MAG: hypothetical protein M3Y40_04785, partial [Chloroflexota bacterium]|nr:hypothetical protein [Chloroflexota bacterium]
MRGPALVGLLLAAVLAACGTGQARNDAPASVSATTASATSRPSAVEAARPELVAGAGPIRRPAQPPMSADLRTALVADHCVDRDLP